MTAPQIGDTVKLESKLLFGDDKWREGTVTAVADDGRVTAEFPQPPYPPMKVTGQPDEFVVVHRAELWSVPKVAHDDDALVGPRILGGWIYRAAGQSDAAHTRQYAAQLLAAADELDRRNAGVVTR